MFVGSSKGYVLKRGPAALGLSEQSGGARTRHFVVGFSNPTLARHVHYCIDPVGALRLQRSSSGAIDVSDEVRARLDAMGLSGLDGAVRIDVNARLFVPKMRGPGGPLAPLNDGGLHLDTMELADLYLMPFSQNIGLIKATSTASETARELVLECHVIDPVDSTRSFRTRLHASGKESKQ